MLEGVSLARLGLSPAMCLARSGRVGGRNVSVFTDVFRPLLDLHPEAEAELRAYLDARSPVRHQDEMLTVLEAAAKWKMNPETVRRWIREERIPQAEKVGREWRIPVEASVLTATEVRDGQKSPRVTVRRSKPPNRPQASASAAMRELAQDARRKQTQRSKEVSNERAA